MPRFGPWPASLKSIPSTLARSWCRCARQVIKKYQKQAKNNQTYLSFVLKIGITIHKISTFWPKKNLSGMFLFSSQDLGIRVNGYSPLGGKGNPNQAWPPKNWLVQILPELPEVWVLMLAECYVAICCYMLLHNVAPPVVSWYMKL